MRPNSVFSLICLNVTACVWGMFFAVGGESTSQWLIKDSELKATDWPLTIEFAPDDKTVVASYRSGEVKFWDAQKGKLLKAIDARCLLGAMAVSQDRKFLATGHLGVILWNLPTLTSKASSNSKSWIDSLAFSRDGMLLASGHDDGVVMIWDLHTLEKIMVAKEHSQPVVCVVFSDDGQTLVSTGEDNKIVVWDVQRRAIRGALMSHKWGVRSAAFVPGTNILLSGSKILEPAKTSILGKLPPDTQKDVIAWDVIGGELKMWDVTSMKERATMKIHDSEIRSIAVSRNGNYYATGSRDGKVIVWDTAKTTPVQEFLGHTHWVECVAFSADGNKLASCGRDQTIRVWNIIGDVGKVDKKR
jgi:WD40 repeat protein